MLLNIQRITLKAPPFLACVWMGVNMTILSSIFKANVSDAAAVATVSIALHLLKPLKRLHKIAYPTQLSFFSLVCLPPIESGLELVNGSGVTLASWLEIFLVNGRYIPCNAY